MTLVFGRLFFVICVWWLGQWQGIKGIVYCQGYYLTKSLTVLIMHGCSDVKMVWACCMI